MGGRKQLGGPPLGHAPWLPYALGADAAKPLSAPDGGAPPFQEQHLRQG